MLLLLVVLFVCGRKLERGERPHKNIPRTLKNAKGSHTREPVEVCTVTLNSFGMIGVTFFPVACLVATYCFFVL